MNKYVIISLSIVVLGFIILTVGLVFSNIILNALGCVMIILPILILKIKDYGTKRKSILEYMENKDKSILPLPKTKIRKKEIISSIMSLFITIIVIAFISIALKNYFFKLSDIDIKKAESDGCAKLSMGGTCITEPSKIYVPYDVNKDGIVGGIGDSLEDLLRTYYNCTGSCVRKRCGCPG